MKNIFSIFPQNALTYETVDWGKCSENGSYSMEFMDDFDVSSSQFAVTVNGHINILKTIVEPFEV